MERPQRYCPNCGAQVSPEDAFCGNCGKRLSSGLDDASPTREMVPESIRQRASGYALPSFLRFPDPGRDALLGLGLAVACAGLLVATLYVVLAIRGAFSDPSTPGTIGLALFVLMHGGAASINVPPTPALLGLGGSLRLGLPVTSFALLPFFASLLAARFVAHRARTPLLFVLVAAVAYAVLVAALAALGGASSESGDMTIQFAPDPLSTALRAFLWVGFGTMLGVAVSRGPLLPAQVRQVLRGALWAVGISLAVALVLAVVISLVQQGLGGGPAPMQRPTEGLPQPAPGASSVRGVLGTIGAVFTLLPIALGNLWLLAHGVPVGFQNASDLSGIPLIGEALADVPLRGALLGDWPWGWAWRLLLVGPLVGLVFGGIVAARGASPEKRWQQGALVAVPYAAIALLTAILVGVTADVTLAEAAKVEVTFRASLVWLLLLLPVGAGLGAVGGLLSKGDAFPVPHPRRAFLVTSLVSAVILLASLPALAAFSPGSTQPASPLAPGEQSFTSPPSYEGPREPTTPSAENTPPPEEDTPPEPIPSNSEADPAFDPLLSTLRQKTSAPIMLPAELPEELKNIAIDADQSGDRYGILFLYEPSGNKVQSYVHANDAGTLTAAPEPPDTASEFFEATKEETVKLPHGTKATLRYMEPKEGELVNQGPFWESSFEKEGYTYTLRVPLADPSGDIARQVLSTMVEISDEAAPGSGPRPGYQKVTDLGGALSVEVPIRWETMTSDEASVEVRNPEGLVLSQELTSAEIDAAPELDLYFRYQESGTSLIVVKALAQDYTDDQLLDGVRGLYRYSRSCSDGGRRDYERAPYSGRIQTWNDCNLGVSTVHTLVAAPKDRECAALLWIRMVGESDRKAAQHILDTFKVDCGRLPAAATTAVALPSVPASPEAAASPPASPEVSASAPGSASASPCPQGSMQNAAGNTCTDLATGEIVRETPLPNNPNTNPCPEMWSLNEQGRCEKIPLP